MQNKLCLLLVLLAVLVPSEGFTVSVVDIRSETNNAVRVAAQAGVGLENRDGPKVFIISQDSDAEWLATLVSETKTPILTRDFVESVVSKYGCVVYDLAKQYYLPALFTYATVNGVVPCDNSLMSTFPANTTVVANANVFGWDDEVEAHNGVKALVGSTSSLCVQRPDYLAQGKLVDLIFAKKLFVTYMDGMCLRVTVTGVLLKELIDSAPWPRPIAVYGYNHQFQVAGAYVFEASTLCNKNTGSLPSDNATNLAFWSTYQPFASGERIYQVTEPTLVYDATKVPL